MLYNTGSGSEIRSKEWTPPYNKVRFAIRVAIHHPKYVKNRLKITKLLAKSPKMSRLIGIFSLRVH